MIHLPEPHAQMPHPGAFKGGRLKFLQDELTEYTKAVINDRAEDFALDVIRRFFKRYPLDLQDDLEPTPDMLANLNDDEPDEEPQPPSKENMTLEEYDIEMKNFEQLQRRLTKKTEVSLPIRFHGSAGHMTAVLRVL